MPHQEFCTVCALQVADVENLYNMYAWCIERMIRPRSMQDFVLGGGRVTFMTAMEVILAYGFYNNSVLFLLRDNVQVTSLEALHKVWFYPHALWNHSEPILNMAAAIVALCLLCLEVVSNDRETMTTPCPIFDHILLHVPSTPPEGSPTRARRLIAASFMHIIWCIRIAFTPVLVVLGSVQVFAASQDVADIVLYVCTDPP
jgi:hypothetical protein